MTKSKAKKAITNIAIILLIAIFFILDRYLKMLALGKPDGFSLDLIGRFFSFQFTPNPYLAFSLPLSGWLINALIILIILSLIFYIFYLILKDKSSQWTVLILTIILFGAISNILDRLVFGYVIDYLYLRHFTVFNLADVMITGGTVALFLSYFNKQKYA